MLIASKRVPQGRGLAAALLRRAATVDLDWDVRSKSRFDAVDSRGRQIGVFLPRGTVVRGGDVLVAEDGSLVCVRAAPQPVLRVRHCPDHGSPGDLLRAAYHLGNRHVAVELQPDHLKVEPDPVLAAMLRGLHLTVSEERAPFEPEGGAYPGSHDHGQAAAGGRRAASQGRDDDHGHGHGHEQGRPAHDHGHDHGQAHGGGHHHGRDDGH